MKDVQHQEAQAKRLDYHFSLKWGFLVFFFFLTFSPYAQSPLPANPFHETEEINYDLYFKWGLLMPKAGNVSAIVSKSTYENEPAWRYRLLINSTGLVDKAFRVRDTIDSYFSTDYLPKMLFSAKHSNEGGYYQIDRLTFQTVDGQQAAHSFRRSTNKIKLDSLMLAEYELYDILGALTYLRSIDWTNMGFGEERKINVVMGRDMINVSYRYEGQQIIERGDAIYKTRLFVLDIYDESFSQSKDAAEIWIGDDANHVPIKIRAKLTIGAVEAYYNASKNLKYPLNCRIVLPNKRYSVVDGELILSDK